MNFVFIFLKYIAFTSLSFNLFLRPRLFRESLLYHFQVIILIGFFVPTKGLCQTPIADSLQRLVLHSPDDSNKVNRLNDWASDLFDATKYDETKMLAEDALSLAKKIGYKKGQAVAYTNLGLVATENGEYDDALDSYSAEMGSWKDLKSTVNVGRCYNNIGLVYWRQAKYFQALKYNNLAVEARELVKDTLGLAYSHQNIGNVLFQIGKYPEAVQSFLLSLKYYRVRRDTSEMADVQNSLGAVYCELKEYQKAIQSHEQGIMLNGDERFSADAISNIGNAYFRQKKFEEALKYYVKALNIREKYSDDAGIAISHLNIGAVYQNQNKQREALESLFKSLRIGQSINNATFISAAHLNIGISYGLQKKFAQARASLNKSLSLANENSMLELVRECYLELTTLDSVQGDWQSAFSNYKNYVSIRDSMINQEKIGEIKYLTYKYETDIEKEKTQIENAKEIAIANERTINQRYQWIFGVILTSLIGGFSFYNFKKKKEKALDLVKREALNAQMSDHFISNTIDSINTFIENNEKDKASEYLLLFHRLIRRVLENSFQKLVPLESELGVLQWYFELEKLRYKENNLVLKVDIDVEIDPKNILIPPLVFQTLVENSIKHGFKKSQGGIIILSVKDNQGILECAVEDNGMGRSASMLSKEDGQSAYGSHLAERLVTLSGGINTKDSYKVVDLHDLEGNASGTRVAFKLPIILN